jgi:hypothetical protein
MEKYTIKEMYGTDELPKLFCEKGTILRLKKDITIHYHKEDSFEVEKIEHVSKGTLFEVKDIVGYGFDLVSLDSRKREARYINSSMPEHFEILNT